MAPLQSRAWTRATASTRRFILALLVFGLLLVLPAVVVAVTPVGGGDVGGPIVVINNEPGTQTYPHVDGDLATYASRGNDHIHYYDFSTGLDAVIPGTGLDGFPDVSGNLITFLRGHGPPSSMVFDVATGALTEIDPQSGWTAIGGQTVAIGFLGAGLGDVKVYDLSTSEPPVILGSDPADEGNARVSPSGNAVVWQRCPESPTVTCQIVKAVRSAGVWSTAEVLPGSFGKEFNADTDGTVVVYESSRASATGRDIYWQPLAGGAEVHLQIPGEQIDPSISQGVVAFATLRGPLGPNDIFAYVIATNTLFQVTNTPSLYERLSDISVLPNGDVRVVWSVNEGTNGSFDVYGRTFDPTPTPIPADPPSPGYLRVTTDPPLPAQISLNGVIADSWGLNWLKLAPGSYFVRFSHIEGYTDPPERVVTVTAGMTTTVTGSYTRRGSLRVITNPALPGTITVDNYPRNDWGLWTDIPTGTHQVCFGKVAGFNPPFCQTVTVYAGALTTVTGSYAVNAAAPGRAGVGYLRVATDPALPAQISINWGLIADSWGLNWLKIEPSSVQVEFSRIEGYTDPPTQVVTVVAGATTTVVGTYTRRGSLRVITSPAVPGTISVDGFPRNDWGLWTDIPTGSHQVCFGAVSGFDTPPCQTVTVDAGALTTVTGEYQ